MVMFHTIPYAEAKRRGAIQEEILDDLTSSAASLDQVDLARADRLGTIRSRGIGSFGHRNLRPSANRA
jgi:hypothetical protein